MTEQKASIKAQIYQRFVRHPRLNYRAIRLSEHKWGVGQFLGEEQVGIV